MDILELLRRENAEAQMRFRAMLDAQAVADPAAPETIAYRAAERRIDALIADLQWKAAQGDLEALIAEGDDPLTRAKALADGDHFAGMEHHTSVDNVEGDPAFNGSFR